MGFFVCAQVYNDPAYINLFGRKDKLPFSRSWLMDYSECKMAEARVYNGFLALIAEVRVYNGFWL